MAVLGSSESVISASAAVGKPMPTSPLIVPPVRKAIAATTMMVVVSKAVPFRFVRSARLKPAALDFERSGENNRAIPILSSRKTPYEPEPI